VAVRFTFPVTGGSLNLAKLTGTINHQGGILFKPGLELGTARTLLLFH
jgi:hypothetical protein